MSEHYTAARWKIAFTTCFARMRYYKSFLKAQHVRGGLSHWDRRTCEVFNTGFLVEGAKPDRVLEESLDIIHYEMFKHE